MKKTVILVLLAIFIVSMAAWAEDVKPGSKSAKTSLITPDVLSGLEFRNIGPALMS